ncbi:MAG: hypothetical protein CMC83_05610 [Flavobacteriaceae bacterium]|nr:hypothetical protein [Flavobacteriaceae bacterium]
MKIKSLLFFSFLCWFGFSQQDVASIEIIDFNSTATYGPGSSVSVHFNPKGIFKFDDVSVTDDNQFFLELSTSGVDDWETISTLNGFFTTTMNGVIPDGASGFYQLRVRASKGLLSDTTTFGEVSSTPTSDFFIDGNNPSDTVIPYSGVSPNNNRFDCTAEGNYSNDAMFGSLTMSEGETSGDVISSSIQRRILITNLDENSTYNIRRIDVIANTIESVASFASPTTFYTLPENIVIGTYNYEVEEINQSGISSIYTIILVLHRSSTTLGNNSAENVCTETDVIFNIDITSSGIGQNYRGSYYEFDFGDGSPTEIYTHAEILNNQELIHTYQEISCSSGQQFFDLRKDMYNKYNTDPDDECSYQKLGNGVIKQVNTSKGPEALFQSNDICENQSLSVINQSILGQYSISNADGCDDDANYYWDIVSPTGIIYEAFVEDGLPYGQIDWISGDNLLIPSTDLEPGCWSFRLTAVNENYCETESTYPPLNEGPYVVNVQAESDADFQFLNDNGEVIEEICFGQPVTFDNLSTVLDFDCQNVDYLWSISPESTPPSFVYVDPYDNSSESPVVIFNDPGTYDVTLQLSSICGQNSITKTITILGDPTINFDPDELTVCETETERAANGYTLDFSDSSISPIYSEAPFAPSSYTWTIVGDGNFNIDNSNAEYPVINFLDFGTYEISVQVNGSCTGSNNDTFTFNYQRTPVITNTDLNQEICTGFSTTPIVYQSDMTPLNVIYSIQLNGPDISGFNTDPTSYQTGIPAMNLVNDSDSPKTLIITVTPEIDGCIGADVDFTFTVNPEPDISSVILDNICSGGGFSFQPSDPSFENTVPVNTTYTWTVSSNIDPSTATGFTEPSFENAQPGPITQSNLQVSQVETLTYIVTPYFVSDSDSSIVCTGDDFTIQVTVVPDPEVSIITPLDYTICVGGVIPPIETSVTGGTGTPTYTWFKDGAPVDPPVNLPTYDAGIFNIAGVYEFNVTVSFDGSGCDPATSETVTVTVLESPVAEIEPNEPQSICVNGNFDPLVASFDYAGISDSVNITWYYNTSNTTEIDSQTTIVDSGPFADNNTITPDSSTPSVRYYFFVLEFDPSVCEDPVSPTVQITVANPPSIASNPDANQTICVGGTIEENSLCVTINGGVEPIEYSWFAGFTYLVPNSEWGIFPPVVSSDSSNCLALPADFFDNPSFEGQDVKFWVVISFPGSNGCGGIFSDPATVSVLSDPILTDPSPATQEICLGSPATPLVGSATGGDVGDYIFTWYNGDIVVGDGPTYTPPSDVVGTFYYYYVVTTDAQGADCETTSATAEVIVQLGPSIDTQPIATQTVCLDGATQELTAPYSNGVGVPTYQWYRNSTCDTSNTDDLVGTESTYTPPSDVVGTFYYYVVLTFAEGGCGSIVSECALVEITPVPIIPDVNVDICDLTSYTLSPEDGVLPTPDAIVPDETTYTWSIIDSGNIIFDPEDVATEIDFPSGIGAPSAFSSGILDNVDPNFILSTIVFEVTPWTGGCDGTSFFVSITVSPEPQINEVITNIACFDSEPLCAGSIEINPVGIAPFSYVWSSPSAGTVIPNPSDKDQFNLCPGLYDLTITDDSGCSYDYQYEIAPPEPITFDLESLTDVSCNNIDQEPCDGTIQVVATGGTRDYIYAIWYTDIDGDGDFDDIFDEEDDPNADFYDQNNLCADDYVLKIMDANGCVFVSPVYTIEEGAAQISVVETLSNYNGFNIDCYGANTGSISLEISGGSGIFDYTFTSDNPDFEDITANVNFQSSTQNSVTLDFEFLFFSNYTFSLIDSNCPFSIVRNYNLTQPDELVVSAQLVSPPLCFGDVATYEVTATGGIPPYVGTGLQAVLAGPVIFQVSDANGCEDDFSTVVLQPEELSVSVDIQDPFCFGDLGSITVNPSGGTGVLTVTLYSDIPPGGDPNDFIIDSDTTSAGNPVTFSQPDGEYFYSVTDLNGCEYGPEPFELIEPDPINIVDIEVVQPDCNTEPTWEFNNGSICITITGGTNAFPVGPGWVDNGGGVWCLNDLTAGTYSIDATDENNCPIQNPVQDIVLVRPPEITVSFTETISIDCDTNTATQTNFIFIDGGVPPYVITWSGGTAIPPNIMETSEPGNYSAFVNDQYGIANGCPPKEFPLDPITFFEFGIADFSISSSNSDFCGVFAVSDPVTFFNISTGDIVNYTWNFGDGSPDISNIVDPTHVYDVSGSYTISLTTEDIYGCFDTYEQTIDVTKGYEIILPNAFTPNGDGINETIRPVFNCMTEVQMSIYDTWGSLIYSESGEDIYGWDGTIDGNAAENGNYIMVVRAVSLNGNIIDLNGPVTLIK